MKPVKAALIALLLMLPLLLSGCYVEPNNTTASNQSGNMNFPVYPTNAPVSAATPDPTDAPEASVVPLVRSRFFRSTVRE